MGLLVEHLFDDAECREWFDFLSKKNIEYHKPYKRFGKMVKVPRGQASYTLNDRIHYNYGVSGGSPENEVMCDKLKNITGLVNDKLGTNFNTILMNVYKNGEDCIGFHKDKETGWVANTGFATLAFGAERDFQMKSDESKMIQTILHKNGSVIRMPYPLNHENTHAVPKRKGINDCRISSTFREIEKSPK